jgi:TRAP-type C4-dicarboxylate transport system substrate-binding protein
MSKKSEIEGLTKDQQKELQKLATELEADAIQMRIDYEENPQPEMEGMVIEIHQDSILLEDESRKLDAEVVVELKHKESKDAKNKEKNKD